MKPRPKKIKLLYDTLDRLEQGKYTGISISWCADYIAWLWKFRHISHDELTLLTTRMQHILDLYKKGFIGGHLL